jgi:processive 1,2-diacylglycerol beta-glucosyltransferase
VWTAFPSDVFCVADEDTRATVERLGPLAEQIKVTGFPVSLAFTGQTPRAHARQQILYLPSTPPLHVAQTLQILKPLLLNGVKLTLPVGKHGPRLYHHIRRFTDAHPQADIEIIGWTNRIPELLQTHDIVICKAGGAILHEVLAAQIPAVIDYVVPGQEEGNAELLLRHECALRSHTPQETGECVRRLLENGGALAQAMRRNIAPLSEPKAAFKVADVILQTINA